MRYKFYLSLSLALGLFLTINQSVWALTYQEVYQAQIQGQVLGDQIAPFDYSISLLGGRTVEQGKTLYLFFETKVISGTMPANDRPLLTITDIPQGVTVHYPVLTYTTFAQANSRHMSIDIDPTVAPGSYTMTFTVSSSIEGLAHSTPVTINVLSPSQYTLSKKSLPPAVPIPSLSLWEEKMKTSGKYFCNQADIAKMGAWEGSVWFYDGERVFYQIADYTNDPSWNQCALWVQDVYRPVIVASGGSFKWWEFFTKGFRMNYEKTGDTVSQQAITLMAQAQKTAFGSPNTANPTEKSTTMREVSYALEALLDSEAVNHTSIPDTTAMMETLLGQLDEAFASNRYVYIQPYMVGLVTEALIQYYNEKSPDPRIPYHIKQALDKMWEQGWVAGNGTFAYRCHTNGCYTAVNNTTDPPTGPAKVPNIVDMNLLNHLIAPAYAWLFLQTGDPLYRQRGDDIFSNAVLKGTIYLNAGLGKQYSQSYRWSFDYVKYRQQANSLATANSDTTPPAVSVAAPVIETVFDSVAGQNITSSQYVTTYANALGSIKMVAVANDNTDIAGVQFQIDGVNAGPPVLNRPFESNYESALLSNGNHAVTAIAYDLAGNSAISAPISLNVNNPVNAAESNCPTNNIPTGSFQGCYYDHGNTSNYLSEMRDNVDGKADHYPPANLGKMVVTRNDPAINFNWNNGKGGSASPASGVAKDFFAVVWQGKFNFNAGAYTFNVARDCCTRVFIDGTMMEKGWSSTETAVSFNVTFLKSGTHLIRAEYRKSFSNSPAIVSLSWSGSSTSLPADTTPPVISSVSASGLTASAATINWTTNKNSDTQVNYGLTTAYGASSPLGPSLTLSHSINLSSLSAGTLYHYRASSKDAAGNLAVSADFTFTTSTAPDTTPPVASITTPLNNATVSNSTTISATASDPAVASALTSGLANVVFKVDGTVLVSDVSSPYTTTLNTATLSNGAHTITARATDNASNLSALATITVTVNNTVAAPSTPTLTVVLSASPNTGTAPISGVSLTAALTGTAAGNSSYYFYCSRNDTATGTSTPPDIKYVSDPNNPKTAPSLCSYTTAGTYIAKVIVERNGLVSESRANITISEPPPPAAASSPGGGGSPAGSGGSTTGGGSASAAVNAPPPATPSSSLELINDSGTFYLIKNNQKFGITSPGILYSYGFEFKDAKAASSADLAMSQGSLLLPGNGYLVKSDQDKTVYLISQNQRHAFVSEGVFRSLGFSFDHIFIVTDPELQSLPQAANIDNAQSQHLPGVDINRNGTIYWVSADNKLRGYPSLAVYNSWHRDSDFSQVVPTNSSDLLMPVGEPVTMRVVE